MIFKEDEADKSNFQKIVKLQEQFSHASANNLEKLLKQVSISLTNITYIIIKIVSLCKMWQQYKKPIPRPAEVLPIANDFNDTVTMDFHQLGSNLWSQQLYAANLSNAINLQM